jgi:hypothetical protein
MQMNSRLYKNAGLLFIAFLFLPMYANKTRRHQVTTGFRLKQRADINKREGEVESGCNLPQRSTTRPSVPLYVPAGVIKVNLGPMMIYNTTSCD